MAGLNSFRSPLFPEFALARRIELHEAWSGFEHARLQAELYPETGAAVFPIGEGYAVFCGKRSPLSEVQGLGMSGTVSDSDLEAIEAFYAQRTRRVGVRVCPLADPSVFSSLQVRGYALHTFMNVFARRLSSKDRDLTRLPGVQIKTATPEEAALWYERLGAGGDWAEPDGVRFMVIRTVLKPGASLYLAWSDGQPVAGGGLEIHDGLAALMAAETLSEFRGRGIHTALVRARLADAANAGCDLAVVHTDPGTISQNNVLRAGFQLLYTSARLFKMLKKGEFVQKKSLELRT